ncbi:ArsR/SmtB family transcription factor [Gilvimarinus polysaccharolyticus]|uniref:ArsR/SmtB family transcription factor n=1 Tax=Gilvimarinus polysaccharolyticus TaxID=863921 RepID=UPI0006733004|nr:metalloregulator ArsR/SmtB family transcription factor [Gilvimarinus polysaccharolyticus]
MQQQMSPEQLQANAAQAAAMLKMLSNEKRLMILCALQAQELSVSELNAQVPLSQSALSQHLAALREAALVDTRKDGQKVYYRLKGNAASKIIDVLQTIYCP